MNKLAIMDKQTMTSREIAEITGKEHSNILRDIRDEIEKLEKGGEEHRLKFELVNYLDAKGEIRTMYNLYLEGILQLAARYDAVVRSKLITMALAPKKQDSYLINDPIERAKVWIQEAEERKMLQLEKEEAIRTKSFISDKKVATALQNAGAKTKVIKKLEKELNVTKEKLNLCDNYATLLEMEIKYGMKLSYSRVKKYCLENGLEIKKVKDERFGAVNSYPIEAWEVVISNLN